MLTSYPRNWKLASGGAQGIWIDLVDPTPEERSSIREEFGLQVPTREELSEIETTSRLRAEPKLAVIDAVAQKLGAPERIEPVEVFTRILEEVVDRAADHLELSAERLDQASKVVFRDEEAVHSGLSYDPKLLRTAMTQMGRISERISNVQYMLTWIDRICHFTADHGREWIAIEVIERLQAVRTDVVSLTQFDESLLSRVQLLQDAASAIISIGQNEVMKVLTVVSVAGVPPVLIAGIYGMNFKNMPELNWPWGYGFALALIVVSTIIPLIWFKLKRWI